MKMKLRDIMGITNDEYEGEFDMVSSMMQKPKFITITVNGERPEVHIRGIFESPADNTAELAILYKMSDEFDEIVVYINSGGGQVDLLAEMLNVFKKFKTVITIGTGCIASAGFTLWAAGQVRVIQPYTYIMSHRESYGIGHSKTAHHKKLAEYNEELFGHMMTDVCSTVMTPEEIEEAKHSEVYYTADCLIERGNAIAWDVFLEREELKDSMGVVKLTSIGERLFLKGEGMLTPIEQIRIGLPASYEDVIYDCDQFPYEYFDEETEIYGDFDEDEVECFKHLLKEETGDDETSEDDTTEK